MLEPLNGYGYSKQAFDQWMEKQTDRPPHYVGFKFFNVYGPNEYCKGAMASMVFHGYRQMKEKGTISLFESGRPDYEDGGQLRDFVYVKDVCDVLMFMLNQCSRNGLFNEGTGKAQSFRELAQAVCHAMGLETQIQYIPMPENLQEKYQYYTQAKTEKQWEAGYTKQFRNLEAGVKDYVQNYLDKGYRIY